MYHVINNVLMDLNRVGGVFYDYAAAVFIQSALLVILLFIIDLLLRKRIRAVFRYCVWLLVLVKLILPPMLSLPTGIGYWIGDHLPAALPTSNMAFDTVALEHAGPSGEMPQVRPSENIAGDDPAMAPADSSLIPITWQAVVFLLWLAGVLAFLVVLVQRIRFVKGLVAASCPAGDELTGLLEDCRQQMTVRREIKLRLSEAIPSPAVCGLLKPAVLMPASLVEKLSPEGLRATLIHELAHIKRGDLWVNSVQTFLQVVYFYNPFVWFANSIIRKVCEEAVDETVLVALGGQAKDYSNTLIDIGEMVFWKADLGLRLIGVAESKKALQWRIRHMLNRPIPKSSKLGILSIIVIFTAAAVLLPMARSEKSDVESQYIADGNEAKQTYPLHKAAAEGDLEQVKLLLSKGVNVNAEDNHGTIALDIARSKYNQEIAKLIVAAGAETSIQAAAFIGDINRVKEFIERGGWVGRIGTDDLMLLHWAAAGNHKDIAELLINNGANVNAVADEWTQWTPLGAAARTGSVDVAEYLIAHGANVNGREGHWWTPLQGAAYHSKEMVELLLANGANINGGRWTALHSALDDGHFDIVEVLLARGADVNARDGGGRTPLHYAAGYAGHNNPEVVELLLSKGADINAKDNNGKTALSYAIGWGYTEMAELLRKHGASESLHDVVAAGDVDKVRRRISEGADVNTKDDDAQTLLHSAAYAGRKQVAELLIASGADVNARNRWGLTPLDTSIDRGRTEIEELLQKHGAKGKNAGRTQLQRAAASGDIEKVKSLISQGADLNEEDKAGWTPLLLAASKGRKAIVELLISKGAEVNRPNLHGLTALHLATCQKGEAVVELLLDNGANISARSKDDVTPLMQAAINGNVRIVILLIEYGADIRATRFGETALHGAMTMKQALMVRFLLTQGLKTSPINLAAYFGEIDKVNDLLAKGINVNSKDACGYSPLYSAAFGNQLPVMKFLITKGAQVNVKDNRGFTALHAASRDGDKDMVELLAAEGADVNLRDDKTGCPPVYYAALQGHNEIIELLIAKGADVNAKSGPLVAEGGPDEGWTPLHGASINGHEGAVELLISKGADVNAKTKTGKTPLSLTKENDCIEIVELLRKHGAKE